MNQHNSSISGSDTTGTAWKPSLKLIGWTLLWLLAFDIAANAAFPFPNDPRNVAPNRMAMYFDYGRSTESRLIRATRPSEAETAPITLAGWYSPLVAVRRPSKIDGVTVTIYGNSQSVRLADALQKSSEKFEARTVAAPGATANWAYGAFLRDQRPPGEVAVLTIMSSNFPMIMSMSAMTWNTSFAMPYTSDLFYLKDNRLYRRKPPYESFRHYVETLYQPAEWARAKQEFATHDLFYDRLIFEKTIYEQSTLVRLARRGWQQRRDRLARQQSLNRRSFSQDDPAVQVANAIVADFAARARMRGNLPVIHVMNSRGYGDTLYRALEKTLKSENLPFVSTHDLVDTNSARSFLPDGHLTDANDLKLADRLETVISRELNRSS